MFYELQEKLRMLKIDPSCRGVMYITDILEGRKKLEDLNDDQIELVVDAWDSRTFIPEKAYKKLTNSEEAVKPCNTKNLPRKKYYMQVARNVIDFFK